MKSLLVLMIFLIGVASVYSVDDYDNPNADPEYRAFKKAYGISYRSKAKEQQKYAQFKVNKAKIAEHNARYERGEESFAMGMNQFGDSTYEEAAESYLGLIDESSVQIEEKRNETRNKRAVKLLKESWDWREHGGVSPIKHQGSCGSCWAYSATAAVESQYLIKKNQFNMLAEMELIRCVGVEYSGYGCRGGHDGKTLEYVKKYGMSAYFPYITQFREKPCLSYNSTVYGKGATVRNMTGKDINTIKNAVYTYGPCSTSLYCPDSVFHYQSGILPNKLVNTTTVYKHAVNIVGYGKENNKEYLILKNSWGDFWGESGFFRVELTSKDELMISKGVFCFDLPA